jgi:hypothetical protein
MDFHDDEDTMKEFEKELEQAEKLMGSVKAKAAAEQQKQPAGKLTLFALNLCAGDKWRGVGGRMGWR